MVELNGVDESLDTGDDCHEVNLRDRAKMLQYQTCVCDGSELETVFSTGSRPTGRADLCHGCNIFFLSLRS